jgi:hypothetical protein
MTNTPGDGPAPQDPQDPQDPQQEQPYGQQYPRQDQPGQQYGQPPAYGQPQGYPVAYAPDHPKATTSLILGILGIVVCGIIAPFAWRMGKKTVAEIDASNGQLGGRGSAQAGYILGLIGTVLLGIGVAIVLIVLVVSIIGLASSSTSS